MYMYVSNITYGIAETNNSTLSWRGLHLSKGLSPLAIHSAQVGRPKTDKSRDREREREKERERERESLQILSEVFYNLRIRSAC